MNSRNVFYPVLLVVVVIAMIIVAFVWLGKPDKVTNPNLTPPSSSNSNTQSSPDRVKASNPPNGDTTPSPSGTGPGPEGDLLSQ